MIVETNELRTVFRDRNMADHLEVFVFLAIQEGDWEKLQQLINDHPEIVNLRRDHPIATPLHACIFRPKLAELLLQHHANPNEIDNDDHRIAPLHLAAESGDVQTASILLQYGADVNLRSRWGTPLHHALGSHEKYSTEHGLNMVKLLLEWGAEINAPIDPETDCWTPLHQACSEGLLGEVQFLLDKGANPALGKDGLTPLVVAQSMGHQAIVELLQSFSHRVKP